MPITIVPADSAPMGQIRRTKKSSVIESACLSVAPVANTYGAPARRSARPAERPQPQPQPQRPPPQHAPQQAPPQQAPQQAPPQQAPPPQQLEQGAAACVGSRLPRALLCLYR